MILRKVKGPVRSILKKIMAKPTIEKERVEAFIVLASVSFLKITRKLICASSESD